MADKDGLKVAKDYHTDVPFGNQGSFHVKGANNTDWGMKRHLSNIFDPVSGNTVMFAFDHGYFMGSTAGLERLDLVIPKLQEQVDSLVIENNNLQQERYELERLQELYQLDQSYSDYKKTAAHVIGNDSGNWFSTFTIDKGSNDGIAKDMNVMAGSGLVGIVTDVGPTWAKVRSIVDDSSNVSGMVLSTSDRCVVSGDLSLMSDGQIRFSQMENNDNTVSVGDQIVTSYISDKYLQGILIGYVSEVTVDSNNLTRSGYITPAVDFKNLQEVLIITSTKADLTGGDKK